MQSLLAWASWDADRVRDDLPDDVVGKLGDADAVLVISELSAPARKIRSAVLSRSRTPPWPSVQLCTLTARSRRCAASTSGAAGRFTACRAMCTEWPEVDLFEYPQSGLAGFPPGASLRC